MGFRAGAWENLGGEAAPTEAVVAGQDDDVPTPAAAEAADLEGRRAIYTSAEK